MSEPLTTKVCVICKQDVSTLKRVKDPFGRYYCEPCYKTRAAQRQTALSLSDPDPAQATIVAPIIVVPVGPSPVAAPPLNLPDESDDLKLSTALTPPAASASAGNLLGCGSCKKLFPESDILNVDGEFVCRVCHAQRGKVLSYAAPDDVGVPRGALLRALGSTTATIGIAIAAAFAIVSISLFFTEPKLATSTWGMLGVLLGAAFITVVFMLETAVLMVSMLAADRIIGGIEFGTLGSAVAKSLGLIVLSNMAQAFIPSWGLYRLAFPTIIFYLGMIILFKTDSLEATLIAVINMFANIAFMILMAAGIAFIMGMLHP